MKTVSRLMLAFVIFFAIFPSTAVQAEPEQDGSLSFSVLSDIHVQSWDRKSQRKLIRALNDLHHIDAKTDALIINGDLGNGFPDDYEALRNILQKTPHAPQIFFTIGNHEFYKAWHNSNRVWSPGTFPNGETEQASIQRFLAFTGESEVYFEKRIKGYRFLFLGSEQYRQSNPDNGEDAYLSEAQLAWLNGKLQEHKDKPAPVFVFLHQPLPNSVGGSFFPDDDRAVIQHTELKQILSQCPAAILFSGHTHWALQAQTAFRREGFTMANTSSVYEPLNPENQPYDEKENRSEGLFVQVEPGKVVIRGRDLTNGSWIGQYVIPAPERQTSDDRDN